jgi:hypothetical protein
MLHVWSTLAHQPAQNLEFASSGPSLAVTCSILFMFSFACHCDCVRVDRCREIPFTATLCGGLVSNYDLHCSQVLLWIMTLLSERDTVYKFVFMRSMLLRVSLAMAGVGPLGKSVRSLPVFVY